MKALNLTTLTGAMLVLIHNALADKEIKKFKSNDEGITTVTDLVEAHTKGKDKKIKLLSAVSKFPLAILEALAPGVPLAKELFFKVKPAHQRILKRLLEAGANTKAVDKDKFAKTVGVKPDDSKYADVLTELYSLGLMGWEEDGGLTILDNAINFVNANSEAFDSETPFADLACKAEKKTRVAGEGGTRSRVPKTATIKLLTKDNPCNPAKTRHAHFAAITDGCTVEEYVKAGGNMFNLNFFVIKGYVELSGVPVATPTA